MNFDQMQKLKADFDAYLGHFYTIKGINEMLGYLESSEPYTASIQVGPKCLGLSEGETDAIRNVLGAAKFHLEQKMDMLDKEMSKILVESQK